MKDDYRWYNSAMFAQKDAILQRNPELAPQIYNNPSLKPFLQKPTHFVQQELLRDQAATINKNQAEEGDQKATLFVCCPQGKR